jgi:cytochrome c553
MRAIRLVLGIVAAIALAGLVAIYGVSEWRIRRQYEAPLLPLRPASPADPVAGLHMAKLVGCWMGCHGDTGEGGTERIEGIRSNTAPTLSQVVPGYSDEELARVVRYGVKRDGTSALGMASSTFWALGDQDLADIFAHLRRQPPRPPVPRKLELTFRGRVGLATGAWQVSAAQVDRSVPRWGELPRTTPFERGRYLASIICSECHGLDFRGFPLEGGPSLAIVAIYDREQFRHLLHTGKASDGREIAKMSWGPDVGFTDQETDDLYAFLREYHGLDGAGS